MKNFVFRFKFHGSFVPMGLFENESALVQVMAWRRTGVKPLLEPMLTQFADAYNRHSGRWVLNHPLFTPCCDDLQYPWFTLFIVFTTTTDASFIYVVIDRGICFLVSQIPVSLCTCLYLSLWVWNKRLAKFLSYLITVQTASHHFPFSLAHQKWRLWYKIR